MRFKWRYTNSRAAELKRNRRRRGPFWIHLGPRGGKAFSHLTLLGTLLDLGEPRDLYRIILKSYNHHLYL